MARYFIQVSYNGAKYAGFQIQNNANTIQAEIQKALSIFFKTNFALTCSSRTDAGVHALNNFFHLDAENFTDDENLEKIIYSINSILPTDIVIKRIYRVPETSHCRFDALSREYKYYIYISKNPFYADRAFYYPYKLDIDKLNQAAELLLRYSDFTTFSKKNTQVKTFDCKISQSKWIQEESLLIYQVQANRFLRGMVRGLVGTMLKVGTGKISIEIFKKTIESKDCRNASFAVPPQGLFLIDVKYPWE